MESLDAADKKVLFELCRNCRQSQKQIARRVGLSRDSVMRKIKKLESAGVVSGYYTLIDFTKLGYMLVRVYIKLQNVTEAVENKIVNYLTKERTLMVYKISGSWDMSFGFLVESLVEFDKIWIRFLSRFKRFVRDKSVSIFLRVVHYARNYLVPEKFRDYSEVVAGVPEKFQLRESDIKLLRIIAANGKASLLELAKALRLTPAAAKFKMRSLERKGVILAYRAIVDINKLGVEYYKVDVEINDLSSREKIQGFLRSHPNVVYEDVTFGGSDLEFDVEVASLGDFKKLMFELEGKFPNAIKFFSFFRAIEIVKLLYMPPD